MSKRHFRHTAVRILPPQPTFRHLFNQWLAVALGTGKLQNCSNLLGKLNAREQICGALSKEAAWSATCSPCSGSEMSKLTATNHFGWRVCMVRLR